jgi:hypothetical protein
MNTCEKTGGRGVYGLRRSCRRFNSVGTFHLTPEGGTITEGVALANEESHSPTTASASTSTSISGEIRLLTCTMLVAGRIDPKNSPCARPTFSH